VEKKYYSRIEKDELLKEILKIQRAVKRIEKAAYKFKHKSIRSKKYKLDFPLLNSASSILIENGITKHHLENLIKLIDRI
jgi:hypothetical protein